MADVTEKVMDVTGRYAHPGKFEGGAKFDKILAIMETDDNYGSIEESGWIGFYMFTSDPADFIPSDGSYSSEQDVINTFLLAKYVRGAVAVEDDQGFFYAKYFDTVESAEECYHEVINKRYPFDDDGDTSYEILREVD